MSEMQHITLDTGEGERHCLVYVPEKLPSPAPLVVFLHGAGGTAEWSLEETRLRATAEREGFLLVAPNASRADPTQPAMFRANPQVWNDGVAPGQFKTKAVDDVAYLSLLLDEVTKRYPIDERRVYAVGFSNGGSMVLSLGQNIGHWFAGLVCVAGQCWSTAEIVPKVPTLYLVGSDDPLVPLSGGMVKTPWGGALREKPPVSRSVAWLAAALWCEAEPVSRMETVDGITELYAPKDGPPRLDFRIVAGLGHHWPGGLGRLSKRLFGPARADIDANTMIWDYFLDARRHQ